MDNPTGVATIHSAITEAEALLASAGIEGPRLAAEALMGHKLGVDRAGLYVRMREPLDDGKRAAFDALVKRRASREPLQYITGEAEFLGHAFSVTSDVLIPRPETELLVTRGAGVLSGTGGGLAADIGTGSGCIAVSLALLVPGAKVYAVDSSKPALALAAKNADAHGVEGRVKLLFGDLLSPLSGEGFTGGLDLIVSNPPYIPSGDIPGLQPEVLFEPMSALDGGPDGLDAIKRLITDAPNYLRPGGTLLMEIGLGQAEAVRRLIAKESGLSLLEFIKDFQGIERVLAARRN